MESSYYRCICGQQVCESLVKTWLSFSLLYIYLILSFSIPDSILFSLTYHIYILHTPLPFLLPPVCTQYSNPLPSILQHTSSTPLSVPYVFVQSHKHILHPTTLHCPSYIPFLRLLYPIIPLKFLSQFQAPSCMTACLLVSPACLPLPPCPLLSFPVFLLCWPVHPSVPCILLTVCLKSPFA